MNTKLKKLIEELKCTVAEGSKICGVSERTFYRWLSGESRIPAAVINMFTLMLDRIRTKQQ